ncbi:MAG: hypothetical protein ACK5XQ_00370 [Flavobacteriales bacterium]
MRLLLLLLLTSPAFAQYTANPIEGMQWLTVSGGLNTADNVSWQAGLSFAKRGEVLMTQMRAMYSQELIEAPDDTCFASKNKLIEIGLMWGEGWGGRYWYVSGGVGLGLNVRSYCDYAIQNKDEFRTVTAVTIGVPAQIDAGIWVSKTIGINLQVLGNWNFRQPYIGAHLGCVWRMKEGRGK